MKKPTGKLKFAYDTISNMEAKIKDLESKEERVLKAIKNCFPLPECTDGYQRVNNDDYNKLVAELNN